MWGAGYWWPNAFDESERIKTCVTGNMIRGAAAPTPV